MKTLKKIGLFLLDFVEVWMPTIALGIIFVAFIVNVISRYVFRSPVNACYELCLAGLVWTLLLSAPYAVRTKTNVAFTLLYDKANATTQLIMRLIGSAFLLFCLIRMFYPCLDWVLFMHRKRTSVLKIRYDILFFPFVIFNALDIFHFTVDLVVDLIKAFKAITGKEPLVAQHHSPLSEAEEESIREALGKEAGVSEGGAEA